MSEKNVEVVRRAMEAFARGDRAAFLDEISSEVVIQQTAPIPDARSYHGHEGMVQVISDWAQVFDDLVMTAEELTDVGNNRVLARVHQSARGVGSRVPIEFDTWFVYSVAGGRIARLEMFNDREEALEAAGLSE
jgi:ketosteroid isomerase-like protein